MRDHEGCTRGYHRFSKTYYASEHEETTVSFGMYDPQGGTSGEMSMVWVDIGYGESYTPQLKVFDDGWSALGLFTDLIQKLAEQDSENITEEQFCTILDQCGFKDLTTYEDPHPLKDKLITIEIEESKALELGLIK